MLRSLAALLLCLSCPVVAAAQGASAPPPAQPEVMGPQTFMKLADLAGDYAGSQAQTRCHLRLLPDGRAGLRLEGWGALDDVAVQGQAVLSEGVLTLQWRPCVLPDQSMGYAVAADGSLVPPASDDRRAWEAASWRWQLARERLQAALDAAAQTYSIVPWEGWIVLVQESAGEAFCRAVNAGVEPAASAPLRGDWMVRGRAQQPLPRGTPEVPAAWRAWLLRAPEEGRLITARRDGTWWAEFADGTGLLPGMLLHTQASETIWLRDPGVVATGEGALPVVGTQRASGEADAAARRPVQRAVSVRGRVVEVAGARVAVRWEREDVELQAGAPVGSLELANGATLAGALRDTEPADFDGTRALMAPGTEAQRYRWQALLHTAFFGGASEAAAAGADTAARRAAARAALAELDPAELVPACLAVLAGRRFDTESSLGAVGELLAWWDARQGSAYALGFDLDVTRRTPLATAERTAALARWAAWWARTVRSPQELAAYGAAVRAAGAAGGATGGGR